MRVLRLATRRSPLALAQAQFVQERLRRCGVESELVPIVTHGDRDHEAPLEAIGGRGVFAVEVQRAVLDGTADVAVHSAKDLPSATPAGLDLVCVPERRDAADVLVGRSLAGLGPGATVATGSPRRRALLLERRPDLRIVGLRGNMATRLALPGRDGVDAVVAAMAALERLEADGLVSERLDPSWFVPRAPGPSSRERTTPRPEMSSRRSTSPAPSRHFRPNGPSCASSGPGARYRPAPTRRCRATSCR
jgi:hydroxymethylbilane synthase